MEKPNLINKKYLFILVIGAIMALGMISIPTSSAASTVSVNTTGNDANTGTSADPYQTISTGINKVDYNGTVKLSKGTFNINNGLDHSDYGITISRRTLLCKDQEVM